MDVLPALLGVGYICGARVSSYIFAGGVIGWFVLMPLIALFGADLTIFPASVPVSELGASGIWSNYIRYIGAGAVAAGGIISLVKNLPLIAKTFRQALKSYGSKGNGDNSRLNKDIPMNIVILTIGIMAIIMWLVPAVPVNLLGAIIIVIFGFFFATVSSRMVGIVGSSNNPVSGMAIATLLITTMILKATGTIGMPGMVASIAISFVLTYFFGGVDAKTEKPEAIQDPNAKKETKQLNNYIEIDSPVSGKVVSLSEVKDDVFSKEIMGKGIAIEPTVGKVVAPFDGTVSAIFPTNHAVGLTNAEGVEVLVHVGLDTVELNGKNYTGLVKNGDTVKKGDTLVTFDIDAIKAAGYDVITPVIITNSNNYVDVIETEQKEVNALDCLLKVFK